MRDAGRTNVDPDYPGFTSFDSEHFIRNQNRVSYDGPNYELALEQATWTLAEAVAYAHDLCPGERRNFDRSQYGYGSCYNTDVALDLVQRAVKAKELKAKGGRVIPQSFVRWAHLSNWVIPDKLKPLVGKIQESVRVPTPRAANRQSTVDQARFRKLAAEELRLTKNATISGVAAAIHKRLKKPNGEFYNVRVIRGHIRPLFPDEMPVGNPQLRKKKQVRAVISGRKPKPGQGRKAKRGKASKR